jgi:hypothetical protein
MKGYRMESSPNFGIEVWWWINSKKTEVWMPKMLVVPPFTKVWHRILVMWRTPKLLDRLKCKSKCENNGRIWSWGMLPGSQHFEGRGVCWSSRMGTRTSDKGVNYSHKLAQTKQVGYCIVGTLRVHWDSNSQSESSLGSVEGSFPRTLLYSWEHRMRFSSFTLGLHLCKSLPWSQAQG